MLKDERRNCTAFRSAAKVKRCIKEKGRVLWPAAPACKTNNTNITKNRRIGWYASGIQVVSQSRGFWNLPGKSIVTEPGGELFRNQPNPVIQSGDFSTLG